MLPVYCEHFRLAREPFNVTPDPSFLYLSASHKEALAQLVYGIRTRRGFVVLTGEVGTGKTTLIQSLLEEINDGHTHCAFLFDLTGSAKDLLRALCQDFAIVSPTENEKNVADYLSLLNQFLLESYQNGDNVAVIIDEAQNLPGEVLERVRLLSNFETPKDKLLQILLVGQPELGDRLNEPELRQLKQRVALRHHLRPLNFLECKEYIAKRLEVAGGAGSLFAAGALEMVYHYSGGVPRLVNILCDNGLLSAYALRKAGVEAAMIKEIAQDLHLTVPRQNAAMVRGSAVARPMDAPLGETRGRIHELTEIAVVERPEAEAKPLTGRLERVAEAPQTSRPPYSARPAENGAGRNASMTALVPRGFFESMVRAFAEAMGPLASFVVRDHVAAMGESQNAFPMGRLEQLINEISGEIDNETMKRRFQETMVKACRTINGGADKK